MADVSYSPAGPEDVDELIANIRDDDLREIEASSHLPAREALMNTVAVSDVAIAGRADGELVCLFGVCSLSRLSGEGSPWMIGTKAMDRCAVVFLRQCIGVVREMQNRYPVLRNYVDVRNRKSVRWLKWLGFTIKDPVPYGPRGLPFHPFERS